MFLGVFDRSGGAEVHRRTLVEVGRSLTGGRLTPEAVWADDYMALCAVPDLYDPSPRPFVDAEGHRAVVFDGRIYEGPDLFRHSGASSAGANGSSPSAYLARLHARNGSSFPQSLDGKFAIAVYDVPGRRLTLVRDRLGIEPLFYHEDGDRTFFGTSLRALLALGCTDRRLDPQALLQYLLYDFNPTPETLVEGVRKLPPGHLLSADMRGSSLQRYWRLSFREGEERSTEEHCDSIIELITTATRIRHRAGERSGILLSGGTDSSALVSIASQLGFDPVKTFSFRCGGRTYDESSYARYVAERYGTLHSEVEYRAEDLFRITDAVVAMDEPFCDVGIELGTFLLGRAAEGEVDYVLSGEGGDELFAGHPAYTADKVARYFDLVPRPVFRGAARMMALVPDSDQKKNWQVKLKRFSYGLSFPTELLSRRWVTYYTPPELRALCSPDLLQEVDPDRVFEPVFRMGAEADGKDPVSRSIYLDYCTLVGFYLSRLRLLRLFDVESRVPLLDHRLAEHVATIPSDLKMPGLSDGKFIYRRALERVLPRKILYDRPKLGHSVPLKNWLRSDPAVITWVRDVLSPATLGRHGLVRREAVERMLEEHEARRHNHSHRLWGLVVLHLWLDQVLAR